MHSSVRTITRLAGVSAAIVLFAACQDKRVKEVDSGITRDSLLTVIGKGSQGVDSLPNVYQRERYLIDGKNYEVFFFTSSGKHVYTRERYLIDSKNYEVFFFSPSGQHVYTGTTKDTIPWKDLEPIAMIDNVVAGKGWPFLDSLYTAHKIPVKKH